MGDLHTKKVDKKKMKFILFKKGMPYWCVAMILAFLNVLYLFISGRAFGISSGFLYWGAGFLSKLGVNVEDWYYMHHHGDLSSLNQQRYTVVILFIILGSLTATLLASEFRIKKIKGLKQAVLAITGGLLMGFGTRLALGCNIGALLSGISSLSMHGWVFAIFMFGGAIIGSKLLLKLL